jgi:hypothetical protein
MSTAARVALSAERLLRTDRSLAVSLLASVAYFSGWLAWRFIA